MATNSTVPPVAIVGMSSLFAGSDDVISFWRDIVSATDRITDIPASHWLIEDYYDPDPTAPDKTYCKRGGFLNPTAFDPMEFGIPPNAIPATDTCQLLALVVAKRALDDAARGRFSKTAIDKDRTSVMLGVASTTELVVEMGARLQHPIWRKAMREAGLAEPQVEELCARIADHYVPWQESTFPGLLGNVVAGRIANRLDLGGTNYVTDAACASSLSALQAGLHELYLGDSDMVLTGGVDTLNDILMYMCFSKTPAFSSTGDCRPFSSEADGTIIGEGAGLVALRRLEDAEKDGDQIYAVIKGLGSSSDGKASSVYAPRPEGQAKALARAYRKAGYSPNTVELVEAHGTGTTAGDAAELAGLRTVFDAAEPPKTQFCALGSIKSQIGHTKAAAGSAGLIKTALALHHKVLPPTLKVERPNPALDLDASPFYVNTQTRPWIRGSDHPRRAALSSFGFGGTNFHLALEEYEGNGRPAQLLRAWPEELVLLSAESASALGAQIDDLEKQILGGYSIARIAYEASQTFSAQMGMRAAIVAADTNELVKNLKTLRDAVIGDQPEKATSSADIFFQSGADLSGKTGFLFPGQGSQYVGMGAGIAMAFPAAREIWDASADYDFFGDHRLHEIVFPPPRFTPEDKALDTDRLTEMANAQPAIAAASLAKVALLRKMGLKPDAVAGHSFGELTALAIAGALSPGELIPAARRRGELMTQAAGSKDGSMLAVATNADDLNSNLDVGGLGLIIANDNSPSQTVLAGASRDIEIAELRLRERGFTSFRLPVATAFHSPIVADSSPAFLDYLNTREMTQPAIPVYSNMLAAPYPDDLGECRRVLSDQLANPVRFREMIEAMYADGITQFVEVGPGRVLTGLTDQCLHSRPHLAVALDDKKLPGLRGFWRGLGLLATMGLGFDVSALADGYAEPETPTPAPKHSVDLTGANFGRPYPPPNGAAGLPPPNKAPRAIQSAAPTPDTPTTAPTPVTRPSVTNEFEMSDTPTEKNAPPPTQIQTHTDNLSEANMDAATQFQLQTLEAHRHYQTLMAESHRTFLDLAARTVAQLAGAPYSAPPAVHSPTPHPAAPLTPALPAAPAPSLIDTPTAGAPAPPPPLAPTNERLPTGEPAKTAPPQDTVDTANLLIGIVAEKTGYPPEMLDLNMEMEAGLGIDSIKQVEILSALQEALPDLDEIEPAELAELKSLQDVINRLNTNGFATPTSSEPPPGATPAGATPPPPLAPGNEADLVLSIVADKTGYPVEMLDMDMEMEAGLGIDSIKQVEILSALQEALPGFPEITPAELGDIKTLRDVVSRLQAGASTAAQAQPAPPIAAAPPPTSHDPAPARATGSVVTPTTPDPGGTSPASALLDPLKHDDLPTNYSADLTSFSPSCIPRPSAGFALGALSPDTAIYITDEKSDLAGGLAQGLLARGFHPQVVSTVPAGAQCVICLAGLLPIQSAGEALELHLTALDAAQKVGHSDPPIERLFVSIQATGGRFLLDGGGARPANQMTGGLAGLVKTAAREWPGASVKAIDIGQLTNPAATILKELLDGGPELEVGFPADHERCVVNLTPIDPPTEQASHLPRGSVLVVSGGARGVTARCAVTLAQAGGYRLALLGRSNIVDYPDGIPVSHDIPLLVKALASRAEKSGEVIDLANLRNEATRLAAIAEAKETLSIMAECGIDARYYETDIQDPDAVTTAIKQIRNDFERIDGIVHGAGVLQDKPITDLTKDQFASVFKTKVDGFEALLQATHEDELKLIAVFSSVAARTGNTGQAAYAAANEVLNKMAAGEAAMRGPRCIVRSYNWGPWAGGMVDASLKAHFDRVGVGLIPLDQGANLFASDLCDFNKGGVERVVLTTWADNAEAPSMRLKLDTLSMPELLDHKIKGQCVLPVAAVCNDALAYASAHLSSPAYDLILRDLRVLAGIVFDPTTPPTLQLRLTPASNDGQFEFLVADDAGRTRYSAIVERRAAPRTPPPEIPSGGFRPWPWSATEAYASILFHGASYQAISALEGVCDEGGVAQIKPIEMLNWPEHAPMLHPALLDAGLQLGWLWSHQNRGAAMLPQALGEVHLHREIDLSAPLRCAFRAIEKSRTHINFDFLFANLSGDIIAEVRNAEFYTVDIT